MGGWTRSKLDSNLDLGEILRSRKKKTRTEKERQRNRKQKKEIRRKRKKKKICKGNLGHGIQLPCSNGKHQEQQQQQQLISTINNPKQSAESQLKLDPIKLGSPPSPSSRGDITVGLQPLYLPGSRPGLEISWLGRVAGRGSLFFFAPKRVALTTPNKRAVVLYLRPLPQLHHLCTFLHLLEFWG